MNENKELENLELVETQELQEENIENEAKQEPQEAEIIPHIETKVQAQEMVDIAYNIVEDADKRSEECKLLLESNLLAYDSARLGLKKGGFDSCEDLLSQLGSEIKYDSQFNEEMYVFESKASLEYIELQEISTGKFTGILLAILGAILTASALIYLSIQKLSLDIANITSSTIIDTVLPSFATFLGQEESTMVGASILGLCVFLVMILIYVLRIQLKAKSNFKFAKKQLLEAEAYVEQKGNCKVEMEKVDEHIKDAIVTLKLYEVVLNEQKAKLQRILHIEGIKSENEPYHDKSLLEMGYTKELMRSIRDFIAVPMSENGALSDKSITVLQKAKLQMNKMIERLYERK